MKGLEGPPNCGFKPSSVDTAKVAFAESLNDSNAKRLSARGRYVQPVICHIDRLQAARILLRP